MQKIGVESIQLKIYKPDVKLTTFNGKIHLDKELLLLPLVVVISALYLTFICMPLLTIFNEAGYDGVVKAISDSEIISSLRVSMFTSLITVAMVFILCTPIMFLLSNRKSTVLFKVFETIVCMPTVLPPAVAGIGLLLSFGRNGPLGGILQAFNIEIVFTPLAVILAQFFVSSGFYIQVMKTGIAAIEKELFEVSYILGAGKLETFIRVIIPMSKKTIIAGLIMAWTRSMGEFGATIMFAGNVLDKTRTVPLEIYTLMQMDIKLAAAASAVMLLISYVMLFIVKVFLREQG
ncbi:MAG: ABC transporter permease [Clostridia bacterium]|nr:ABC transporter permease [Clostridia bacterium]